MWRSRLQQLPPRPSMQPVPAPARPALRRHRWSRWASCSRAIGSSSWWDASVGCNLLVQPCKALQQPLLQLLDLQGAPNKHPPPHPRTPRSGACIDRHPAAGCGCHGGAAACSGSGCAHCTSVSVLSGMNTDLGLEFQLPRRLGQRCAILRVGLGPPAAGHMQHRPAAATSEPPHKHGGQRRLHQRLTHRQVAVSVPA